MKRPIYMMSDGQLSRKDNSFVFETDDGKRHIPVEQVSEVNVFGEVNATKKFLEFASQNEILIHYFNHYGYYAGTYYPREHRNSGYMILRQAEAYLDRPRRLEIARRFVAGSGKNMLKVLAYYRNRGVSTEQCENAIHKTEGLVAGAPDINVLMSAEGNMREIYYGAFDAIVGDDRFTFERRSRRPPKNELNTLISFGNSVLYTTVLSQIYLTHLDPRIGFLHATNFRRFTLNLDVSEIFKPIIVDRTIFRVINKRMISPDHFDAESGGIYLGDKGRKVFVSELEQRLESTLRASSLGRSVSYRTLIRMELYKLEKHLMDEKEYEPYVARW